MTRPWQPRTIALLAMGLVPGPALAQADPPAAAAPVGPERVILQALASNPVTAPYSFAVESRGGRYHLRGRVGTKQVHDVAVQVVGSLGIPFNDDLTIDTSAVYASPAAVSPFGAVPAAPGPWAYPGAATPPVGAGSYVYPPPLFGRIDDPFYGLEPPLISYPPWWPALTASRRARYLGIGPEAGPALSTPAPLMEPSIGAIVPPPEDPGAPIEVGAPSQGEPVRLSIDARGVAVLRGTVATPADRTAIGERVAEAPGITEVVNLLDVLDPTGAAAEAPAEPPRRPAPPPPPEPAAGFAPARDEKPAEVPDPGVEGSADPLAPFAVDGDGDLSRRLAEALDHRPALAGLPIRASVSRDVATISGQVPGLYEAMLAFRAAQQTPGIHQVVDRLEFTMPDLEGNNPLLKKGRPEDIEPYFEAQIRRQVGDLAHVDRVRVLGDRLEVRGTLVRPGDRARVEAVLRSMPILRGFQLDPEFLAD